MGILGFITAVYILHLSHGADVCDDVDTKACSMMLQQRPDMCSDPCLSNICKRLCKMCPLNCYKCDEVDSPTDCHNSELCPSSEHFCVATQSFTDTFDEKYKLGCAHRNICSTIFTDQGTKRTTVDGGCCKSDLCNGVVPANMTSLVMNHKDVQINTTAATMNNPVCSNMNDEVCQRLDAAMHSLCTDDCLASKICPRTCGKCYECYQCSNIDTAEECNTTGVCEPGKECYSLETLTTGAEIKYRQGCMDPKVCARFNSAAVVGKRQTDISLGVHCCRGDRCNHHHEAVTTTTTVPTTTGLDCRHFNLHNHHGCPSDFTQIHGDCYLQGKTKMTYSDAKIYCKSKCSYLADFSSKLRLNDVLEHLKKSVTTSHSSFIAHAEDVTVFVGGRYTKHSWHWDRDGDRIDSAMFESSSSHSSSDCLVANYHSLVFSGSSHFRTQEGLHAASCMSQHVPLCELEHH